MTTRLASQAMRLDVPAGTRTPSSSMAPSNCGHGREGSDESYESEEYDDAANADDPDESREPDDSGDSDDYGDSVDSVDSDGSANVSASTCTTT